MAQVAKLVFEVHARFAKRTQAEEEQIAAEAKAGKAKGTSKAGKHKQKKLSEAAERAGITPARKSLSSGIPRKKKVDSYLMENSGA